ncbi:MAG TPA: hypothetical protein VIC63_05950 [Candidatus Limnocylindria bacterium]|jgi:hypothetical protein
MGWDAGSLGPPVGRVQVEIYTASFRVSGHMTTRFHTVGDILNLAGADHLSIEEATVAEYADPGANRGGPSVLVAVDTILFGISDAASAEAPADEWGGVQKRAVRCQLALPPFWVTGDIHVPPGGSPLDGLLNVADRFLSLTDVAVSSGAFPAFDGNAPVVAVQRHLAQILLVNDVDAPQNPLEEILPEEEVRGWIPPPMEPQG